MKIIFTFVLFFGAVLNFYGQSNATVTANDSDNFQATEISMFPNPASDFVKIYLVGNDSGSVEFYNVLGEKVLTSELSLNQTKIDLSKLHSGIYLATIKTSVTTITKKIVKI